MAPPLVKGRALLHRRVAGIAFLAVLASAVQASVWIYQKRFTPVVHVVLEAGRAGNQLSPHADVKLRGLVVGEVRSIRATASGAVLNLALDPDRVHLVPRDVRAALLPKTLFGEKEVVLVVPQHPTGDFLREGDVITQERTSTALETEQALDDLMPVLQALSPQSLSLALNAFAEALRERGDRLGANLANAAAYLREINPKIELATDDLGALAKVLDTLSAATPDILTELDNFAFSSRALVDQKAALDTFLTRTATFAQTARSVVAVNERDLTALARDSVGPLQVYARYSNQYACMLNRLAFQEIEGERVFGGALPGLHITLELTRDRGSYVPGDEPEYKDDFQAGCFGMGQTPIIPYPAYRNPQDGYQDNAPPDDPGEGPGGCCRMNPWSQPAAHVGAQMRRMEFPRGTTPLQALLLAPLAG